MPYPGHDPIVATNQNQLTSEQMYALARSAGWTGQNIDIAVAVAKAESGWVVNKVPPKPNTNGTIDRGLWQINSVHVQYDPARLLSDAAYNAQAAYNISGGGTHWSAWTTYNTGKYKQYLTANAELGQDAGAAGAAAAAVGADTPSTEWSTWFQGKAAEAPSQSAFDARANYPSGPFASAATKGQIIGVTEPAIGYVVRFLYNPSSIAFDYFVEANLKDPRQQDTSQTRVGLPQGTSTSISFQVYFDRTFECRDGSQVGVLTDIHALEWVCGITPDFPFMLPNRVKLMFGAPQQLIWDASLVGMAVEYTHFNSAMIPMRAIVGIKALRMAAENFMGKDDPAAAVPQKPTAFEAATGTGTAAALPTAGAPSGGSAWDRATNSS